MSTLARPADARDAERAGSPPTETRAVRPLALAAACGVVFVGSLALFVWGLDAAREIYFDETWYVPTAREILKSGVVLHPEHPPLAKLLIAAGLRMFGDNPIGWRAMSALFGALTLAAVTIWSFALLRDAGQALWARPSRSPTRSSTSRRASPCWTFSSWPSAPSGWRSSPSA